MLYRLIPVTLRDHMTIFLPPILKLLKQVAAQPPVLIDVKIIETCIRLPLLNLQQLLIVSLGVLGLRLIVPLLMRTQKELLRVLKIHRQQAGLVAL